MGAGDEHIAASRVSTDAVLQRMDRVRQLGSAGGSGRTQASVYSHTANNRSTDRLGEISGSQNGNRRIPAERSSRKSDDAGFDSKALCSQAGEKMRPVYDARFVNRFMHAQHFQMEDMRTLGALIQREDWMVKIDLKDAYLHVPIHPAYRKYLQIQTEGETYQFKALPFGLNIAPQIFTRILKAALKPLRKRGFRFAAYLDDICLLAPSKEAAERQGKEMVQHLQQKGFIMNTKKTCLEPSQRREFLGLNVDSTTLTLSVPNKKLDKIRREVKSILEKPAWPLRKLAATIGLLDSVSRAMRTGHLMTRSLYADIRLAIREEPSWDNRPVTISEDSKEELRWWLRSSISYSGQSIHAQNATIEIWTDASARGWGAVCEGHVASGSGQRKKQQGRPTVENC